MVDGRGVEGRVRVSSFQVSFWFFGFLGGFGSCGLDWIGLARNGKEGKGGKTMVDGGLVWGYHG